MEDTVARVSRDKAVAEALAEFDDIGRASKQRFKRGVEKPRSAIEGFVIKFRKIGFEELHHLGIGGFYRLVVQLTVRGDMDAHDLIGRRKDAVPLGFRECDGGVRQVARTVGLVTDEGILALLDVCVPSTILILIKDDAVRIAVSVHTDTVDEGAPLACLIFKDGDACGAIIPEFKLKAADAKELAVDDQLIPI